MKPIDAEAILLGLTLRYGSDAANLSLPSLGPDKFIFRFDGDFGGDHAEIWRAISDVFINKRMSPTLVNVSAHLNGAYAVEMTMLVDRLQQQYQIDKFDAQQYSMLCDMVDKAGIVYNVASESRSAALSISDVQTFMQTVNSIKDIDHWLSDRLQSFRKIASRQSEGYIHIRSIVQSMVERWERIFKGEEFLLVPNGFPSLEKRKLFPRGKMAVVHGLAGSGKSSFVFQLNLGTAIYLYQNKISGCVAINSLEMEQEDLVEKLASILARVDVSKFINRTITRNELDRLETWADYVSQLPIFIDGTNFLTTSAMTYRASGLHISENGPVVQLSSDYGELFDNDESTEELRVNKVFREQFRLARLINASVIAISQSTVDKATSGKTYIAGADGTRGSRGALHAADIVAELYNIPAIRASGRPIVPPEGLSDMPYLLIQKYRKGSIGGHVELLWEPSKTTFFDPDLNHGALEGQRILYEHFPALVPPLANVKESGW